MGSEMSGHVEELLKAPLEENIYSRVTQVFFIKHLSFESRGPDSGFGGAYRCWEAFVTRAVEEQGLRVKLTRTCALPRHWTTGVCVNTGLGAPQPGAVLLDHALYRTTYTAL